MQRLFMTMIMKTLGELMKMIPDSYPIHTIMFSVMTPGFVRMIPPFRLYRHSSFVVPNLLTTVRCCGNQSWMAQTLVHNRSRLQMRVCVKSSQSTTARLSGYFDFMDQDIDTILMTLYNSACWTSWTQIPFLQHREFPVFAFSFSVMIPLDC